MQNHPSSRPSQAVPPFLSLAQLATMHATIAELRKEGIERERLLQDGRKELRAMSSKMAKVESAKTRCEMRVKELENTQEPIAAELAEHQERLVAQEEQLLQVSLIARQYGSLPLPCYCLRPPHPTSSCVLGGPCKAAS